MTDNELATKIFKCHEYMATEQRNFSTAFQNMIEAEYALCASQMKKANQLAMSGGDSTNKEEIVKIDYAGSEIDAIRKYWSNRLKALIETIEWRNPQLNQELARKYLSNE